MFEAQCLGLVLTALKTKRNLVVCFSVPNTLNFALQHIKSTICLWHHFFLTVEQRKKNRIFFIRFLRTPILSLAHRLKNKLN